jgi:ribokinase
MTVRALVVGSINVDLVLRTSTLPRPGETLLATELTRLPGGKGGNQASALARLGADTTLLGAVGRDADGEWSLAELHRSGVKTTLVTGVDAPTGLAVVLVDDAGDNQIVVAPGANGHVPPPDDITAYDVVVLQLEIPANTVSATVERSRRAGVPVVLNAAPVRPRAPGVVERADVVIVNEVELAALMGDGDPDARGEELLASGPRAVIVTLGAAGCIALERGMRARMAAPRVPAVDTTGAGDVFTASVAFGIAHGWPLIECVEFATAAAGLSIGHLGARGGLPTAEQVTRERGRRSS